MMGKLTSIDFQHLKYDIYTDVFELWFKIEEYSKMIDGLVLQIRPTDKSISFFGIKDGASYILFTLTSPLSM